MPHVVIELAARRSEPQKVRIAEEMTKAIMVTTGTGEDAVSVGIKNAQPSDWAEVV